MTRCCHKRRRAATLLCCALVIVTPLAGCAGAPDVGPVAWLRNGLKVGPDYRRPAAPVANDWIDFNNPKIISDAAGVDDTAWWQSLNDPVLDRLVQSAYQQNLTLRVAGMRVLEARAQRAITAGDLFPQQQQFQGAYERIQVTQGQSPFNILPVPILKRAFDSWQFGFDVAWELDFWGQFRRALESADAGLDASVEHYDEVLVAMIAEVASAYVRIREFEERIRLVQRNVQNQKENLDIVEVRFRNGAVDEIDVAQAKANLEQTEALIPFLRTRLRLENNRLCVLLGTPPYDLTPELGPAPIPAVPPEVVVGIPAELIRRRPDIRQAEREVAAQSAMIGVAAADLYPAFAIRGSLKWHATGFNNLFRSAANTGSIGPGFNWDILNYGRILNNVRLQDATFQQLAVEYQQKVIEANAEVEDAIVAFLESQQRANALHEAVEAIQLALNLAMIEYREGAIDYDPIYSLQNSLVMESDKLVSTRADVVRSLIAIYKGLGGGWQIRYGPAAPIERLPDVAEPVVVVAVGGP